MVRLHWQDFTNWRGRDIAAMPEKLQKDFANRSEAESERDFLRSTMGDGLVTTITALPGIRRKQTKKAMADRLPAPGLPVIKGMRLTE